MPSQPCGKLVSVNVIHCFALRCSISVYVVNTKNASICCAAQDAMIAAVGVEYILPSAFSASLISVGARLSKLFVVLIAFIRTIFSDFLVISFVIDSLLFFVAVWHVILYARRFLRGGRCTTARIAACHGRESVAVLLYVANAYARLSFSTALLQLWQCNHQPV